MKLLLHEVRLPLRHVFTIAHGQTVVQDSLIVELRDGPYRGFGEATASNYYGVSMASMRQALQAARAQIESVSWEEPAELWEALFPALADNRFALCALDQAAHDLWGKRLGAPVWRLWGLDVSRDRIPVSNYTIGIDSVEQMIAKMAEVPGWPVYKIKLGTDHDLEIVRKLRQHASAVFRVDANTAWTVEQTIANARELAQLDVELIEQPLPADALDPMQRVFDESALPVAADESCLVEEDVERCHGRFHIVNIKLVKCGGLTPARRMIDRARELGLQVMVGCMTESTVGISAIAQLLPLLDYVDMDGAMLLARDVAEGVRLDAGYAVFPNENGCGVRWLEP